jgi:hypothetical protein
MMRPQLVIVAVMAGAPSLAAADELVAGAIYCLRSSGDPAYVLLAKVLEIEPRLVHTRQYSNKFSSCPEKVDTATLSWTVRDLPIRTVGFMNLEPKLVAHGAVSAEEAEGVREMKQLLREAAKQ